MLQVIEFAFEEHDAVLTANEFASNGSADSSGAGDGNSHGVLSIGVVSRANVG